MEIKLFFILLFSFCQTQELFGGYYKEAEKYMANMTLEQRIGQIFFAKFNNDTKESDIKNTFPGGFVLFAKDFESNEEDIP